MLHGSGIVKEQVINNIDMPLPIQNLYTGEGAAVVLPQGDKLSQAASDVHRGKDVMNKNAFDEAVRRQDQLINMSSVDLEQYVSSKFTEEQADLIEGFQSDVSNMLTKNNGQLSTKDLIEIQRKKSEIQGIQIKRAAEDKYIIDQKKRLELYPEKYDRTDSLERLDQALNKGEIHPEGILVPRTVVWSDYAYKWCGELNGR